MSLTWQQFSAEFSNKSRTANVTTTKKQISVAWQKYKETGKIIMPTKESSSSAKPVLTKKPAAKPVSTKKPAAKPVSTKKPAAKPVSTKKPAAKPVSTKKPAAKPISIKKSMEKSVSVWGGHQGKAAGEPIVKTVKTKVPKKEDDEDWIDWEKFDISDKDMEDLEDWEMDRTQGVYIGEEGMWEETDKPVPINLLLKLQKLVLAEIRTNENTWKLTVQKEWEKKNKYSDDPDRAGIYKWEDANKNKLLYYFHLGNILIVLDTKNVTVSIGVISSHPTIESNVFSYFNSDGSGPDIQPLISDLISPNSAIASIIPLISQLGTNAYH